MYRNIWIFQFFFNLHSNSQQITINAKPQNWLTYFGCVEYFPSPHVATLRNCCCRRIVLFRVLVIASHTHALPVNLVGNVSVDSPCSVTFLFWLVFIRFHVEIFKIHVNLKCFQFFVFFSDFFTSWIRIEINTVNRIQ